MRMKRPRDIVLGHSDGGVWGHTQPVQSQPLCCESAPQRIGGAAQRRKRGVSGPGKKKPMSSGSRVV